MRHTMEAILKDELRGLALKTRAQKEVTQRVMAEELVMNESSYSVLESGVYMCGTLTAILLLSMQEDPKEFLEKISKKFENLYKTEETAV